MLISELVTLGELLLDSEDVIKYGHYIGNICTNANNTYSHCIVYNPFTKPRTFHVLSRLLLGITDRAIQVDHENRNSLDNRRHNLRVATRTQNKQNSGLYRNNKSGYKGVVWRKDREAFQVAIRVNGELRHLGYYPDAEVGGRIYDTAAKKYFGEFAVLNFPEISTCV